MRIGLEIVPILEGAGLALVGVDGHETRSRLGAHEAPLAPGRESGAAEAAQIGILERLDDVLDRSRAVEAGSEQLVAAGGAVAIEVGIVRHVRMRVAACDGAGDAVDRRVLMQGVADGGDGRVVAAAHARRAHDAHIPAERARQLLQELLRSHQFAGEAVADAHREGRGRRLAVHDDVEMGVERGDLVDLDQRQPHLGRQRDQMAGVQAAVAVLQEMQVLDEEVGLSRAIAEERAHLLERVLVRLPPFLKFARPASARAGMDAPVGICAVRLRAVRPGRPGVVNVHRMSVAGVTTLMSFPA